MKAALIAIALLLPGCAALEGKFEHRVACALAGDKAFTVSEYGPIGITGVLADRDRAVICQRR